MITWMHCSRPSQGGPSAFHRRRIASTAGRLIAWLLLIGASAGSARADGDVAGCTEQDLIDAIQMGASAPGGSITFTQDCAITLTAPLPITTDTTLDTQGHLVTVSGDNAVQLFNVASGVAFTNLGLIFASGSNRIGGALYIATNATVLLSNCTLVANLAGGTNGVAGYNGANQGSGNGGDGTSGTAGTSGLGGAIYNAGNLILQHCLLATNSASGGDGGSGGNGGNGGGTLGKGGNGGDGGSGGAANGGAIYNVGTLVVSDTTIVGNSLTAGKAGAGGTNGTGFTAGYAGSGGAGGAANGAGIYSSKAVKIFNSTFYANTAQGGNSAAGGTSSSGAGVNGQNGGAAQGGACCALAGGGITNCTLYGNTVTGGQGGNGGTGTSTLAYGGNGGNGGNGNGGGLYSVGTMTVMNCTVAACRAIGGAAGSAGSGNYAGQNGSAGQANGGGIASGSGTFTLRNSILSTNLAGLNVYGTITDGGYNISSDATPSTLNATNRNLATRVSPLANNSGPTYTMALATNSPAVNRVASTNYPPTDQRGVVRPVGGRADSGAFELVTAPVILTTPQSLVTNLGSTATLTVTALGDSLRYQWRHYGTNLAGASASSYSISSANITNSGPYVVVVSNRFGVATSSPPASLYLNPYSIAQPTNQEVALGRTAVFVTSAAGSPPLVYQWQMEGTNLTGASGVVSLAAVTNFTLTLPNAQTNAAGEYSLIVANAFGSVTSSVATLTVDAIVAQPVNQVVATGGSTTFAVTALGSTMSYQWRFNLTNNIQGVTGSSYSFNASKNNAGIYDVIVTTPGGSIQSQPATLTVLDPPIFTTPLPATQTVARGGSVTFSVGVTGDALGYQWQFYSTNLPGSNSPTLTLANVQPANAGPYRVFVTNLVSAALSTPCTLQVVSPTASLLSLGADAGRFSFAFNTLTGYTYTAEFQNSLGSTNWTALGPSQTGTGNWLTNQDALSNSPTRFYRVRAN